FLCLCRLFSLAQFGIEVNLFSEKRFLGTLLHRSNAFQPDIAVGAPLGGLAANRRQIVGAVRNDANVAVAALLASDPTFAGWADIATAATGQSDITATGESDVTATACFTDQFLAAIRPWTALASCRFRGNRRIAGQANVAVARYFEGKIAPLGHEADIAVA